MLDPIKENYFRTSILAAIAFASPIILGFVISLGFRYLGRGKKLRKSRIYRLLASSINIIAFIIGVISCLGTLGIDVSALIAGLGLTGLAFGLALKDAVSNFISGLMIILYSPFELGDELEVAGVKGKVVDMDLRYVTIETDEDLALIPNSSFLSSIVKRQKTGLKK